MSRYLLARRATGDLRKTLRYLDEKTGTGSAGDRLLDELTAAFRLLSENPLIGPPRRDIAPDLRAYVVGQYVIFYRVQPHLVHVERVLHQRRSVGKAFGTERGPEQG